MDDPEGGVAGTRELCGRLDDPLEEGVEGELRAQRDAGVDEDAKALALLGRLFGRWAQGQA